MSERGITKTRRGRPRKSLDETRIVELASRGVSARTIGDVLGVSRSTLYARFSDALRKGRALCDGDLQSKQVEVALGGNATMLIWLGKQRLGQRDKAEPDVQISVDYRGMEMPVILDAPPRSGEREKN